MVSSNEKNRPLELGHNRTLTLPEPEPTLPFDLPLSGPTYRHRPDLTAF